MDPKVLEKVFTIYTTPESKLLENDVEVYPPASVSLGNRR